MRGELPIRRAASTLVPALWLCAALGLSNPIEAMTCLARPDHVVVSSSQAIVLLHIDEVELDVAAGRGKVQIARGRIEQSWLAPERLGQRLTIRVDTDRRWRGIEPVQVHERWLLNLDVRDEPLDICRWAERAPSGQRLAQVERLAQQVTRTRQLSDTELMRWLAPLSAVAERHSGSSTRSCIALHARAASRASAEAATVDCQGALLESAADWILIESWTQPRSLIAIARAPDGSFRAWQSAWPDDVNSLPSPPEHELDCHKLWPGRLGFPDMCAEQ